MNKLIGVFALLLIAIPLVSVSTSAVGEGCELSTLLLNQDPYPAVPGEYVKVVFQLSGINDPDCHQVLFELIPQYPFSLDPGKNSSVSVLGGTFSRNFQSHLIIPYDLRIDKDALDGNNPIEVRYTSNRGENLFTVARFNISIQDLRGNFEVSVKDYDPATSTISFDILNIGEHDVEAVTIEVPKQNALTIKGANRNIIGSLDANEDTSFSFEGSPAQGDIKLLIYYTDEINVRRSIEKSVYFDPSYFEGRSSDSGGVSWYVYVIVIIIIVGLGWWVRKKFFKKKPHTR